MDETLQQTLNIPKYVWCKTYRQITKDLFQHLVDHEKTPDTDAEKRTIAKKAFRPNDATKDSLTLGLFELLGFFKIPLN